MGQGILPFYNLAALARVIANVGAAGDKRVRGSNEQEAPFGDNMYQLSIKLLMTTAVASSLLLVVPSFADSQTRIVRLSDVHGDVQIDRNTRQGYDKAFVNLPLTQGVKIQTKQDGRAEVEFEDGSTVRITPDAMIEFPQLSLRDSGAKVSTISVQQGTAYVDFAGAKNDEFILTFGHEKLALRHPAHLRVEMSDTDATVAVFKGEIQVEGQSGTVQVAKNRTVTFDLADKDRYTLAKDVEPDPYDSWDKQQDQYHQHYMGDSSYSSYSPYAYGTSDLNYYGSFFNEPGYGMIWQPYFIGAGWDPFMNGAWAFNPGYGYGWVSGYPWGWTPYHYGSWVFLPSRGWAWQPGGSWAGWNTPRVLNPPAHFLIPQPPANLGERIVVVNRGPIPTQFGRSFNKLEIPNNSAGLGIPRGSIKSLGQLSQSVQQEGFARTKLHPAQIGGSRLWRSGYARPTSRTGAWHGNSERSTSGAASVGHSSGGHSGGGHR
jgi:FecR protein